MARKSETLVRVGPAGDERIAERCEKIRRCRAP
jgi:hypothetical protein